MIKSILRIHAKYLKPFNLFIRQFWWSTRPRL